MSVIDLITRVDAICKEYDKYDIDWQMELNNISGVDGFAGLYGAVEADLETALPKSEMVSTEKNRATAVAMNAEIRRTKARLLKLRRLAPKKVKGLSKEDLVARSDLLSVLKERIEAIYQMDQQVELNKLVVGRIQPHMQESKLIQLQMGDMILSTFNTLRSRIALGTSMKCEE